MGDRIATIGPIAAVAGAVGLCCGLPVLLSMGVVGAIAGWSLKSWSLIGLGLALTAVGWARWARGRRQQQSSQGPVPPTPVDAAPVQTADSTTDISTDSL
jgi:predicted alpha/beta hydrolase